MGSFYVNTTVYGRSQKEVAEVLIDRTAFVSPTVRGCTVVLDEACDSQLQEEIVSFAAVTSYRLECPALSVLVHDDDGLFYWLHRNGRFVDMYQSSPGMFAPPGITFSGPVGGNPEALAGAFGVVATRELRKALEMPHGPPPQYIVETLRHRDLVAALQLPPFSPGLGYGYFQRGDVPDVPRAEFLATGRSGN
jgi:hypothetical protein